MGKTLNIVGAGRVGSTLARLWAEAGVFEIQHVVNSTLESARRAVGFIGAGQAKQDLTLLGNTPVWLIGVHDSAIKTTAADLARLDIVGEGDIVFHCSGSLAAEALSALAERGALTASVHPVKSFVAPVETMEAFAGTWCAVEGNEKAVTELEVALKQIGARVLGIDAANKLFYHAASVFSCNYLSALMEVALRCIEVSGVERKTGLELLEPLVRGTVDNLFARGPASALTGPIARGDHQLVTRQLVALSSWREDYAGLYRELGEVARELAAEEGRVGDADLNELAKVLGVVTRP